MPKFRKKPVVIEAHRATNRYADMLGLAEWCGGEAFHSGASSHIIVPTLEGKAVASSGDWIIKGINGEFYPCNPDIFAKTYEPE